MTVTSFNIPQELIDFMDGLISSGKARTRTEIITQAIENYARLQAYRWKGHIIIVNGLRNALISKGSLAKLVFGMSEKDQYQAGRRMGMTLKESAYVEFHFDPALPERREEALRILEQVGWGKFTIDDAKIVVEDAFVPPEMLRGYLEVALEMDLTVSMIGEETIVLSREAVVEGKS
jgi:hypothetical protein